MSDLSRVDVSQDFMPRDEDYDPDAPLRPRKPQRAGVPRAAKENDVAAALERHVRNAIARHREMRR